MLNLGPTSTWQTRKCRSVAATTTKRKAKPTTTTTAKNKSKQQSIGMSSLNGVVLEHIPFMRPLATSHCTSTTHSTIQKEVAKFKFNPEGENLKMKI